MAFFRTVSFSEPSPAIEGETRRAARRRRWRDYDEWAALRETSRDFLTPWEPTWPADDLTRGAFRRRLKRYAEDLRTDQSYAVLHLSRDEDSALVGGLTLANIRRGVAQAGSLGYWMGQPFVRRGYMTAAVGRCCPSPSTRCGCTGSRRPAFRPMSPRSGSWRNAASRARAMPGEYLCINGIWQDHLLYARLRHD